MFNNNFNQLQMLGLSNNNQYSLAFPHVQQSSNSGIQGLASIPLTQPNFGESLLRFSDNYPRQQQTQQMFFNQLQSVPFQQYPVLPFSVQNQTPQSFPIGFSLQPNPNTLPISSINITGFQQQMVLPNQSFGVGSDSLFQQQNIDHTMKYPLLIQNNCQTSHLLGFPPQSQQNNCGSNLPHLPLKIEQPLLTYQHQFFLGQQEQNNNALNQDQEMRLKRDSEQGGFQTQYGPRSTQKTCQSISTCQLLPFDDPPLARHANSDQLQLNVIDCKNQEEYCAHLETADKQSSSKQKKLKSESALKKEKETQQKTAKIETSLTNFICLRANENPTSAIQSSSQSKINRNTRSHASTISINKEISLPKNNSNHLDFHDKMKSDNLVPDFQQSPILENQKKKSRNTSKIVGLEPNAIQEEKLSEDLIKKNLIELLDASQIQVLKDAILINRQNINRNLIKQFKAYVESTVTYTLGYEQEDASKYHFKTCRLAKVIRTDNPTSKQKMFFSKKFKKFIASKHHSNSDIKQIIENKIYGYLFREFLVLSAPDWIESNMADQKKSDYETILQFYILCLDKTEYLLFLNDTFALNRKTTLQLDARQTQTNNENQPNYVCISEEQQTASEKQSLSQIDLRQTTLDNLIVLEERMCKNNQFVATDSENEAKQFTEYQEQLPSAQKNEPAFDTRENVTPVERNQIACVELI